MADLLEMTCACGYGRPVRTGGFMLTWKEEAYWPFYCSSCGIVDVNIQASLACPDCKSQAVSPYGRAPVSLHQDCDHAYVQAWDYRACRGGHLCPVCGQHDLKFTRDRFSVRAC